MNQLVTGARLWFGEVQTKEEAEKLLKDSSYGLYIVGALQLMSGFFLGDGAVVEGMIFAVLGYLLLKLDSEIVSYLVLTLCGFQIVVNLVHASSFGASVDHLALSLIAFWVGLRSLNAAKALKNQF